MVCVEDMRLRLGLPEEDSSQDALISSRIADAEQYVRTYCHLRSEEEIPDFLVAQMVEEDWGRLEGAGLSSASVSGASEVYRDGYSSGVTAMLRALRHPGGEKTGGYQC